MPNITVTANDTTSLDVVLTSRPMHFAHYVSTSNVRTIADFDSCNMLIIAQDTVLISDIDVTVRISHTCIGDLDVWLRSPDGQWVQLAARDSSNIGHDIWNCRFDDQADLSFTAGHAPYSGRFRPEEPLSEYVGDSLIATRYTWRGGYWSLYVYDGAEGDEGRLVGFEMNVAWQTPVAADNPPHTVPGSFSFDGNYPNPFNSETHFKFSLASESRTDLTLYNLLGQQVARIADGVMQAGTHDVLFNADRLTSGVYLARLSTSNSSITRKVLLLR
jgi:subtilisin-like proprotein convertase family protein